MSNKLFFGFKFIFQFVIVILWIFHTFLTMFLYYDLPPCNEDALESEENSNVRHNAETQNQVNLENNEKDFQPNKRDNRKSFFNVYRSLYNGLYIFYFKCIVFNV